MGSDNPSSINPVADYQLQPIGTVHSWFREKFGIPRQPGIVPEAKAVLEIAPPYHQREAFRGLDDFSHIWILFIFHRCNHRPWKSTVRPPRLGGNRRVGVFASRSGFRPNLIGQSPVSLEKIKYKKSKTMIHVSGADLLDGTPILDIKPYIPYADSIPTARAGYADTKPSDKYDVSLSPKAQAICEGLEENGYPGLQELIRALLSLDPRPAYLEADHNRHHGFYLSDLNIQYRFEQGKIIVETISQEIDRRL